MNIIHHNPDKTVGIISGPENLTHIGAYSPKAIKEWLKTIDDIFGTDIEDVQILVKKCGDCEAFAMFASHNGESPFVMVSGRYRTDGGKWEDLV